jgi:competence protein ComFC
VNLLDLFFPKKCAGCNKYGGYFCRECVLEIRQSDLVCPFCERPSLGGVVHAVCKRKFGLDGYWNLGVYGGNLRKVIQKFKYKWVSEAASDLVDIILKYWVENPPVLLDRIKKDKGRFWTVTCVPLHPVRQKWRGFNQSELLAKLFAEKLGLEYKGILERVKNTTPQMKLSAGERRLNIKNAFKAKERISRTTKILLVDDVWTTGSTLKECCFELKKSGAGLVWALTIAG